VGRRRHLFVLWLIGFIAQVGGGLIHLLFIAVIVLIINLLTDRKTV
jgi:hypothetical protein